jgi:hypothetical protein
MGLNRLVLYSLVRVRAHACKPAFAQLQLARHSKTQAAGTNGQQATARLAAACATGFVKPLWPVLPASFSPYMVLRVMHM